MKKVEFINRLRKAVSDFASVISTPDGQWVVKGYIDVYRNIYPISSDTKVISKIFELYIFPLLGKFASDNGLEMEPAAKQNFYPDITFTDRSDGSRFAVDIKSSYRTSANRINGMTLGAFTGYFRNRESSKNITYPYAAYDAHLVLGVIYSANEISQNSIKAYGIDQLDDIASVIKGITFFVQEKWRIASDLPGSGNTKNIGSVLSIDELLEGNGKFATLGEDVFDDYWMNYLTLDMAKRAELIAPYYNNLSSYKRFRNI